MPDGTDRVMVDIETLGRGPGCAILSIGAVRFNTYGPGRTFDRSIDLTSCEDAGLTLDAETLEWWLDQDDDAQHVLTGGDPLDDVLTDFADWLGDVEEIWANSPAFDCAILAAAYEALGRDVPWEFWQERDVRTLRALPGAVDLEHEGVTHDALDDAVHQAREVAETLQALQEANP